MWLFRPASFNDGSRYAKAWDADLGTGRATSPGKGKDGASNTAKVGGNTKGEFVKK